MLADLVYKYKVYKVSRLHRFKVSNTNQRILIGTQNIQNTSTIRNIWSSTHVMLADNHCALIHERILKLDIDCIFILNSLLIF